MTVRVVLIDDNDAVRFSLRRGLAARYGIEIVGEANGGLTGIEVVGKERPDVVIVDWERSCGSPLCFSRTIEQKT